MAKKPTAAAPVVAQETQTQVFTLKTHAKRSEIKGAARNTTVPCRGVTLYLGLMADGRIGGNSTTQVDYVQASKQDAYRSFCSGQDIHKWMTTVVKGSDAFFIMGCDATGTPIWTPDEAAASRRALEEELMKAGVKVALTGKMTKKNAVVASDTYDQIRALIPKIQSWIDGILTPTGAAENEQATTEEKVEA